MVTSDHRLAGPKHFMLTPSGSVVDGEGGTEASVDGLVGWGQTSRDRLCPQYEYCPHP